MPKPEPTPIDFFSLAKEKIKEITVMERRKKFEGALRKSVGIDGGSRHRIDLSNIKIRTSLELSNDMQIQLAQLHEYGVILTKYESVCFLLYRGVAIDLKKFKKASEKRIHEARFGSNRLGSENGHLFTYAELCILAAEPMVLEF